MTLAQPDLRFFEIKEFAEVCKQGNIERVRELLHAHPDVLNSPDYDARFFYPESCLWSPLGIAARHGHEELVRFLREAGANPGLKPHGQYWHRLDFRSGNRSSF
jgi:ankyrin repeat protein